MKKIIAALLLVSFFLASCEKDDICDPSTETTSRVVIQFFDKNNISLTEAVTNLKIVGDGIDTELLNPQGKQVWNDTIVYIPLRVNEDSTKYELTLNANDGDILNDLTDILEINYTRNNIYISRACGFKTEFNLFGDPLKDPFVLNNTPDTVTGNWIKNIQVIQSTVNNENEAHIKIFF
jgi:hypothetical protein